MCIRDSYCCESLSTTSVAGAPQVLCAGIDINPALEAQGIDADDVAATLKKSCSENGGMAAIPDSVKSDLTMVAKILNIDWILRGVEKDARLICPRSGACPRSPKCHAQIA